MRDTRPSQYRMESDGSSESLIAEPGTQGGSPGRRPTEWTPCSPSFFPHFWTFSAATLDLNVAALASISGMRPDFVGAPIATDEDDLILHGDLDWDAHGAQWFFGDHTVPLRLGNLPIFRLQLCQGRLSVG